MSWPTIPAAELMLKRGGSVNPANYPDETFELLSIPAFDKGEPEIVEGKAIGSSKSCIQPNDVLLSKIVPHIKRCWVVPAPTGAYRQIGSGEWIIFRSNKIHPPFLRHFLTSEIFHKQFMNTTAGVGGSLVRARPAEVGNIKIPLPPLPEQKRIAAILDKADAIRRKRQQAIQLADDFLRAVFLDMFGDPVTNPKGWKVKTLASITKDWRGGASIKPDDFIENGFPVLHKGAIHQHGKIVLDESKKTFVSNEFAEAKKGSLVGRGCVAITLRDLVPSGPSIGLMADLSEYETDTYLLSQGAYGFSVKPEELHAGYLVALSNHDGFRQEFKKISVGSTQIHIRSSDLKELAFPVPPVEFQFKYNVMRRAVIDFQKKAAAGAEGELFLSLSQKAFSGQL